MPIIKCGWCGKEYTIDEWVKLEKIPRDDGGEGNILRCSCGYRFSLDKWELKDTVTVYTPAGKVDVTVSTVFLERGYDDGKGNILWFETVVQPDVPIIDCHVTLRYSTKEEAETWHKRVVEALKEGYYSLAPSRWTLRIMGI